ncbi:hypothetical protein XalbCFBP2523_14945 [Xanthomonas albilineans]|nr:hypothetical protein XalbCFBP2523_14945 [Xanthomonas albilineans]
MGRGCGGRPVRPRCGFTLGFHRQSARWQRPQFGAHPRIDDRHIAQELQIVQRIAHLEFARAIGIVALIVLIVLIVGVLAHRA